ARRAGAERGQRRGAAGGGGARARARLGRAPAGGRARRLRRRGGGRGDRAGGGPAPGARPLSAPARRLLLRGTELQLGGSHRALLMGIVNASPASFSDGGLAKGLDAQVALGERLLAEGADILDVGGESASTGSPPVAAEEEIARVVPLIERLAGDLGALVSVDTYKPVVARAAVEAGARIVNDVSGLRDPELASVCAETGAALVLMHTAAAPRERRQDPDLYEDVAGEVETFLRERIEQAVALG